MLESSVRRFLVTAGNTREAIDTVRDWGNIFSGNTGFNIARALVQVGQVDLLTSNEQHLQQVHAEGQANLHAFGFKSHVDLIKAIEDRMKANEYHGIFMTAAVSDYRPVRTFAVLSRQPTGEGGQEQWIVRDVQAQKIRSTHSAIAILGEPTEKIIDLFRTRWKFNGLLVKFKLEVGITPEQLIEVGQKSRKASGADYLVANTLDMLHGSRAGAYLLSDAGSEWIARPELAGRLTQLARL